MSLYDCPSLKQICCLTGEVEVAKREHDWPARRSAVLKIALAGLILVARPFTRKGDAEPATITHVEITAHTHNDDKDRGDGVIYSIIKGNNVLWTSNGGRPIGTDLVYGIESNNLWIEGTPPIILDERRMLQLVVEKTGSEHGWIASFSATGNNGSAMLISETGSVLLGKENPVTITNPLNIPGGYRFEHHSGSTKYFFPFDA